MDNIKNIIYSGLAPLNVITVHHFLYNIFWPAEVNVIVTPSCDDSQLGVAY